MSHIEKCTATPTFYTVSDIRNILGVGRNTAYRLVSQNDFPTIYVGNRIVIPADLFLYWFSKQTSYRKGVDKNGK
jgi:hypothetical protein